MEGTFLWLSFWNGWRGKRNIFGLKQPPKTALINRSHDSETKPDITFLFGSTTLPGFNLLWMQPDWLEQRGVLYSRMRTRKITSSTSCSLFSGTLLREKKLRGWWRHLFHFHLSWTDAAGKCLLHHNSLSAPDSISSELQKRIPKLLFSFK